MTRDDDITGTRYPRSYSWERDGAELEGKMWGLRQARGQYGPTLVVDLELAGGDVRTLWLGSRLLKDAFAEELERRGASEFEPGERVIVRRGELRATRSGAREYREFTVEFPDAPKVSSADLLRRRRAGRRKRRRGGYDPSTAEIPH